MSEKRDYYELIGVAKEASPDEIRRAYKKLALQHHPDRNPGNKDAETQFKAVTEAYQVLSDPEKRDRYDRFGHAGLEGRLDFGDDIFSHFQDLFSDFFGGFGGFGGRGGPRRRHGPERGRDVRVDRQLSLEQSVLGCKEEVTVRTPVPCEECSGSGAKPGTEPERCTTCNGTGQVSTGRGFIVFSQTCPSCRGEGSVVAEHCERCGGAGWQERTRTVLVTFPPGIDTGHRLRVAGQGMPGRRGGPPGDLYVDVTLEPDERFERNGSDLIARVTISFPEAVMGTTVPITWVDGTVHEVKLSAGVQPGEVVSVRGKGVPRVDGRGVGSLHVVVQVDVPRRLSRRAKKLVRQLSDELGSPSEVARPKSA